MEAETAEQKGAPTGVTAGAPEAGAPESSQIPTQPLGKIAQESAPVKMIEDGWRDYLRAPHYDYARGIVSRCHRRIDALHGELFEAKRELRMAEGEIITMALRSFAWHIARPCEKLLALVSYASISGEPMPISESELDAMRVAVEAHAQGEIQRTVPFYPAGRAAPILETLDKWRFAIEQIDDDIANDLPAAFEAVREVMQINADEDRHHRHGEH